MSLTKLAAPAAALLMAAAANGQGQLAITEVCDGTLTGGQPKFIEFTNVGNAAIADLSAYSLYNFNNGGCNNSFDPTQLNAVSLAAGDSYVVAYENSTNTACDPNGLVTCFEFVYALQTSIQAKTWISAQTSPSAMRKEVRDE